MTTTTNGNADHHKRPGQLQHEAAQVRERLEDSVDELTRRLSPGELLDQALGAVQDHGGDFGRNLGTQVKNNPLPLLMTGIGMSWLMASSNRPPARADRRLAPRSEVADPLGGRHGGRVPGDSSSALGAAATSASARARDAQQGAKDRMSSARDGASGMAAQASARGSALAGEARVRGEQLQTRARDGFEDARDSVQTLLHEQPLVAGAVGVALGAVLGALFAPTQRENRMMGATRDSVVEKGEAMARDQYNDAKESLKQKANEAREDSKAQPGDRL